MHERLWAPWRLSYITNSGAAQPEPKTSALLPGGDPGCFLCRAVVDANDRENLVLGRGPHSVIVINRYPYNNGHLLIAPRLHKATLADLDDTEHLELQHQLARCVHILQQQMNAEGFNIGLNLGRVAGAGLPGHLHWHVVPRWSGDTNFMPVLAGIRVIPQALDELWSQLHPLLSSPPPQAKQAAEPRGERP